MASPCGGISLPQEARLKSREQDGTESPGGHGHRTHTRRSVLTLPSCCTAREKPGPEMTVTVLFFFFFFNLSWFWLLFCSKKAFFKKYIKQIHFTKMSLGWSHQQEMTLPK